MTLCIPRAVLMGSLQNRAACQGSASAQTAKQTAFSLGWGTWGMSHLIPRVTSSTLGTEGELLSRERDVLFSLT